MYVYTYTHICIYTCMYMYIHRYIHIYRYRNLEYSDSTLRANSSQDGFLNLLACEHGKGINLLQDVASTQSISAWSLWVHRHDCDSLVVHVNLCQSVLCQSVNPLSMSHVNQLSMSHVMQ